MARPHSCRPFRACIRESLLAAREYLEPGAGTAVLDLYCGLGGTLREWTDAGSASLGSSCRERP